MTYEQELSTTETIILLCSSQFGSASQYRGP